MLLSYQISLTCIPALTPLFAYYREKTTTARNTPRNTHDTNGSNSTSNQSHAMRRFSRKLDPLGSVDKSSREYDDSESQESILAADSLSHSAVDGSDRKDFGSKSRSPGPGHSHAGLGGITRTTELDVEVSPADEKMGGGADARWR